MSELSIIKCNDYLCKSPLQKAILRSSYTYPCNMNLDIDKCCRLQADKSDTNHNNDRKTLIISIE